MNNQRRKQITKLIEELEAIKLTLEEIQGDEQDYLDNMPENLQDSARAEASQDAIDLLEYAGENVTECTDNLTGIE